VRGAFSLAAVHRDEPTSIVAARRVSPLVVGLCEDETLLASDIPALLGRTRRVVTLDDDQLAELTPGHLRITTLDGDEVAVVERTVDWDLEAAEKEATPTS